MKIDSYLKDVINKSIKIAIVVFIFGLIFQIKEIYIGFTYGAIISILNFIVLAKDAYRAFESNKGGFSSSLKSYLKRYSVIIILMIGAIKISTGIFIGAAFGLLLIKYTILINNIFTIVRKKIQTIMKGGKWLDWFFCTRGDRKWSRSGF